MTDNLTLHIVVVEFILEMLLAHTVLGYITVYIQNPESNMFFMP